MLSERGKRLSDAAGEPSIDRPSSTASLRVATNPLVSLHLLASDKATAASARELTEAALEHIITPRFAMRCGSS